MNSAFKKTFKSIGNTIPTLVGILLLLAFFQTLIPIEKLLFLFQGNFFFDAFIGATIGSISAGNPATSYIIGGELYNSGISISAVTAFLVSWVTVGIIQLPAEMILLGKRFALLRNILSFLSAILIGIITYLLLSL